MSRTLLTTVAVVTLLSLGTLPVLAQSEPPATPAPTVAPTPTDSPTAAPTDAPPASPTAAPSDKPQNTPWPWPFPWMTEEMARRDAAAAAAAAPGAQPPANGTSAVHSPARGSITDPGSPDPIANDTPAMVGDTTEGDAVTPTLVEGELGKAAEAVSGIKPAQECSYAQKTHELRGGSSIIIQANVRNTDCTQGTSQLLIQRTFASSGLQQVDMLNSAINMTTNASAFVSPEELSAYLAPGGVQSNPHTNPDAVAGALPAADAGPASSHGTADSMQTGNNDVVLDELAVSATGDAMSGTQKIYLQVKGNSEYINVGATNSARNTFATSADSTATNQGRTTAGPRSTGTDVGTAGQIGDNTIDARQRGAALTGNASAGSQLIDIDVDGSVNQLSVTASNAAENVTARSGTADVTNQLEAEAGPVAEGSDVASSGQIGDNVILSDQRGVAASGDAMAGSQVIGIDVTGRIAELSVLAANSAENAEAVSGDAIVNNGLDALAGARASSEGDAGSAQIGDNSVDALQIGWATSGRALAGAQDIRVNAGQIGEAAILNANNSAQSVAVAGDALVGNDVSGHVGADSDADGSADTVQDGHNSAKAAQRTDTTSGDAIAGSSVVGLYPERSMPVPIGGVAAAIAVLS